MQEPTNNKKGIVIAIVAVIVLGGGAWFLVQKSASSNTSASQEPQLLAGDTDAPLRTFTQEAYEAALADGNKVLLWYYAAWCPTCKIEQGQIIDAFNAFEGSGIVGFRVNINDNDTDENEIATARRFGVSFRHTKVLVEGTEQSQTFKTTELWNTELYLQHLNEWTNQS